MSGGHYDYLFLKEIEDLFHTEHLTEMAERLSELNMGVAAEETEKIIVTLRIFRNRMQAMLDKVRPVWYAVEWLDSGDSSIESVNKAYEKFLDMEEEK